VVAEIRAIVVNSFVMARVTVAHARKSLVTAVVHLAVALKMVAVRFDIKMVQ
jgi:hypothetical protein